LGRFETTLNQQQYSHEPNKIKNKTRFHAPIKQI